ncbi:hypothetical protein [Sanguibacter antarcticus]|uniref:Carboxypeptidase regulatory-like domain-containing protein n=1 Tax=Sanguibacter antarcticus TaxID=372484 RepID=A0A2A9E4R7_9MICO|nr:hypothetical protein [Sanguibacter antarcticus]PFG34037.1 hypothetical protein ATL42_1936 [Sanguibacter antarcticus]
MNDHVGRRSFDPRGCIDPGDERVLSALSSCVAQVDPVPHDLVDRVLFVMTLEGLHAETMEVRRIGVPEHALRSEEPVEAQTITFTSADLSVMISLSPADGAIRMDGWISEPGVREIELHRLGAQDMTVTDAEGRFVFARVPHGQVSLIIRDGDRAPLSTPVIEL